MESNGGKRKLHAEEVLIWENKPQEDIKKKHWIVGLLVGAPFERMA